MSYEQNRKKIEIDETTLDILSGTLDEVLESIKDQHKSFSDRVSEAWGFDTFVVIDGRIGYYYDTETPHLVAYAYRWETDGEYDLRIRELKAKKDAQIQKELELLAKLKQKYEN